MQSEQHQETKDRVQSAEISEETYIRIITLKTATLVATCCALGARFAGATERQIERLENYGRCLGIAFQIQDDILDIVGDAGTVGKTLGIDIEKQKMTLPVIHFLATAPAEHQALLRSLISSRDADKIERIRNLIMPSRSIDYARDRARQLITKARAAISELERGVGR